MVAAASQVYAQGRFVAADFEKPAETDLGTFDLIMCCGVIEHLVDPDILLSFIKAHADSETTIVLSTPERDVWRGKRTRSRPRPNACANGMRRNSARMSNPRAWLSSSRRTYRPFAWAARRTCGANGGICCARGDQPELRPGRSLPVGWRWLTGPWTTLVSSGSLGHWTHHLCIGRFVNGCP